MTDKNRIRVGSRDSALAVVQSKMAIAAMQNVCPETEFELITMKTTGDKVLDRPLDAVGGRGLFVKELDQALYEGRCELTVHSLKDMPLCPNARELLRMLSRANLAASNITSVVVSRTSEFKPPMIPASATGFLPSQITRLFGFKVNSFSSSECETVCKGLFDLCYYLDFIGRAFLWLHVYCKPLL